MAVGRGSDDLGLFRGCCWTVAGPMGRCRIEGECNVLEELLEEPDVERSGDSLAAFFEGESWAWTRVRAGMSSNERREI